MEGSASSSEMSQHIHFVRLVFVLRTPPISQKTCRADGRLKRDPDRIAQMLNEAPRLCETR